MNEDGTPIEVQPDIERFLALITIYTIRDLRLFPSLVADIEDTLEDPLHQDNRSIQEASILWGIFVLTSDLPPLSVAAGLREPYPDEVITPSIYDEDFARHLAYSLDSVNPELARRFVRACVRPISSDPPEDDDADVGATTRFEGSEVTEEEAAINELILTEMNNIARQIWYRPSDESAERRGRTTNGTDESPDVPDTDEEDGGAPIGGHEAANEGGDGLLAGNDNGNGNDDDLTTPWTPEQHARIQREVDRRMAHLDPSGQASLRRVMAHIEARMRPLE